MYFPSLCAWSLDDLRICLLLELAFSMNMFFLSLSLYLQVGADCSHNQTESSSEMKNTFGHSQVSVLMCPTERNKESSPKMKICHFAHPHVFLNLYDFF